MQKLVYGRAFLALSVILCFVFICLIGSGCNKNTRSNQAATTEARDITLLVYVDRSESIMSYPGGLDAIRNDYKSIAQGFLKPILQRRDGVIVEARAFVCEDVILFDKKVDKWEQIRKSINDEIDKDPYPAGEVSKTLFSNLLVRLQKECKQRSSQDVYVLVLTDGHPDEPFKAISDAAKELAKDDTGNLKALVVAPVAADMKRRWRENLIEALSPISCSTVANAEDFRTAVDNATKTLEGE
ncbi:MAG: hypothetical protein WC107_04340 [Patescibacteria group bacterium]